MSHYDHCDSDTQLKKDQVSTDWALCAGELPYSNLNSTFKPLTRFTNLIQTHEVNDENVAVNMNFSCFIFHIFLFSIIIFKRFLASSLARVLYGEGEEYEDEKTESNGEKDEIKGDNSTETNSEINEDKPSSANLNNKSMSSTSVVESVSTALSQVSLKQKNNVQKTNKPKGSNPRILNNTQNGARNAKKINSDSKTSIYSSSSNSRLKNESLRWELECDDLEEEEERIRVYKINRRKRYLAAAQAKGLGWVANYASNGSPVSEDSGIEMRERETNLYSLKDTHKSVNDFSTLQTLGPTHSNMNNGVAVDC
ncbi:hypothetical protein KUTeg_010431 [Tegillarca granosa]|uniref:Uncharacterized protein n=1 Tax=Tegillarca granosa TaxID=220873 RepID=A0ABQ9F6P6_TEGGR|nr:hypothetical protein KUTeg_010431 [Tegillarca granosa]